MAEKAVSVANTFLELTEANGDSLTPMKLQKLVYYAHGWHLAIQNGPLVEEGVEAWQYGPVVKPLYHALKEYGARPITGRAQIAKHVDGHYRIEEPSLTRGSMGRTIVEKILEVFGVYTAIQLTNMTHAKGTPWDTVVSQIPGGRIPANLQIPDELIREHFKAQMS